MASWRTHDSLDAKILCHNRAFFHELCAIVTIPHWKVPVRSSFKEPNSKPYTQHFQDRKKIFQHKNNRNPGFAFLLFSASIFLDICMSTSKQDVRNNRRLTTVIIRAISLAYITQKAGFSRGAAVMQHRSFVTQSNKILCNS